MLTLSLVFLFFFLAEQLKAEADYERFLRDLEEDEELRQTINIFKDPNKVVADDAMAEDGDTDIDDDDEEEDLPQIRLEELLDEMNDLKLDDDGDVEIQE